jgi:hypothetical protein
MRRREFITLLGVGAAAWPLAARGQQAAMPVVGYVRSGSRAASAQLETAFRQGLLSLGFEEGRNVAIDYRYAENRNEALPSLIAELIRRQVALIYAADNSAAVAAKARRCRSCFGSAATRWSSGWSRASTGRAATSQA